MSDEHHNDERESGKVRRSLTPKPKTPALIRRGVRSVAAELADDDADERVNAVAM